MKLPRFVRTDIDGLKHKVTSFDHQDIRICYTVCGIRVAWFMGTGGTKSNNCSECGLVG